MNTTAFTRSRRGGSRAESRTYKKALRFLRADVRCLLVLARLALDDAAPLESTGAPLVDFDDAGVVLAAAAHEVAAVDADARLVALSAVGSLDAWRG